MGGRSRIEGLEFDADESKVDGRNTKVPGTAVLSYAAWCAALHATFPGLLAKVTSGGYVEESPSGGVHLYFRYTSGEVPGNEKWARYASGKTKIETRGTGGQFVVAPTEGYKALLGMPEQIPCITSAERETLRATAESLTEKAPPVRETRDLPDSEAPGDAYVSDRGWAGVFEGTGWTWAAPGGAHAAAGFPDGWCRPGHIAGGESGDTSAVSSNAVLMVFSTTAQTQFEDSGVLGRDKGNGSRTYTMSEIYAALHNGDSLYRVDQEALYGRKTGAPAPPRPPCAPVRPATPFYAVVPRVPSQDSDLDTLMSLTLTENS
jgi:hypothetical protein